MSYKGYKANTFSEIGFDPNNNKFLFGISSEIEFKDGSEIRYKKWLKVNKISWFYFRIWIFKFVVGISLNFDKERIKKDRRLVFWKQKKKRNNFKIVFGRAGIRMKQKYDTKDETEYLLSNPHNKKKLLETLKEDGKNNTTFQSVKDFREKFGIKKIKNENIGHRSRIN